MVDDNPKGNMGDKNNTRYKIIVSILFGLLGFVVNFYSINFPFPPYTATVLIGLLFPMLITLTWGWRYGLLSALAGGCQSMWWIRVESEPVKGATSYLQYQQRKEE
jgi:thiamine transporter ThiT